MTLSLPCSAAFGAQHFREILKLRSSLVEILIRLMSTQTMFVRLERNLSISLYCETRAQYTMTGRRALILPDECFDGIREPKLGLRG